MAERWQSGLMHTLGERESGKPDRGFKSHPLRHARERASMINEFSAYAIAKHFLTAQRVEPLNLAVKNGMI